MKILKCVTLEPVMILYFTSLALTSINGQNLLLQKACHPGDAAPPAGTICQDERESQKVVTRIQTWKSMIILFGPVLFVLFAGPWSDNHGKRRKPLMYLPLCGQILSDLLCSVNVFFWSWSPEAAALSEAILPAVTGWRSCFFIGMNSYISDITSEESRTVRIGIIAACYFLGNPIGAFLYGLVFHTFSFYGVFFLCVFLNSMAVTYLYLIVKETEPDRETVSLRFWEGMIDPKHVLQSFKTVTKSRGGYRRAILLLSIVAGPLTMAPLQGEYSILYFFLRFKFGWNETDYGYYAAYKSLITCFGTLITLGVFSRVLGMSDAVIGLMSSVTLILAALGYAFCTMTWQLFLYPIVDFMHGANVAVVYSMVSKVVESRELGQVNSMLGVADAAFPLLNIPLYSQVYNQSFTHMPGAFFLLSVGYGCIVLVIFSTVYALQRAQGVHENAKKGHDVFKRNPKSVYIIDEE